MTVTYIAEITAQLPGSPGTAVLRIALSPDAYNHPSAPGNYLPHLDQPALLHRSISKRGQTFGPTDIAKGELVIDNSTGEYDAWLDYGYGSTARLLLGDTADEYSSFVEVLSGTVEQAIGDKNEITFKWRDSQLALDVPVQSSTYDGSNSGTTGTEGLPGDLKGQPKIRIFGVVLNVAADEANTSDQLFVLNHDADGNLAAITSVDGARLRGSDWTPGTDYPDLATLQAASPTQGIYDTALDLSLERFGGTITGGEATFDATESTGSGNHPADIAERLLTERDKTVNAADLIALETAAPYKVGIVIRGQSYRETLDAILGSVGATYYPDRHDIYRLRQITAPSGTPAAVFRPFTYGNVAKASDFEVQVLERVTGKSGDSGVPCWKVTVNYARINLVQSKDSLADSVSEEVKAYYSQEYRSVVASDAGILTQWPLAVELTFDSLLIEESDAQAMADHYLDLYGVKRDFYNLTASYDVPLAEAIDLGDVVQVFYDRFNLQAGKLFLIIGIEYDAREHVVKMELWG